MRRNYEKPKLVWNPIRSGRGIAAVCWGHAQSGKPFYYNTYGTGYAELICKGSCKDTLGHVYTIKYYPEDMSTADRAAADADMQRVIAELRQNPPNAPNPYKDSIFTADPDPSWS